ncbi:MAG: DUF1631 family protein, partial [Pseudoxanthomonas sp.]
MSSSIHNAEAHGRDSRLLDQARATVIPPLVDTFAVALGRFDDALFDRAERAGHSQMAFLDAMRELRRRREEIIRRFRAHLDKAWQSLEAGDPLSIESALAEPSSTLSLVSDQELESRLAARNLASVIMRDCKPVLARLDRRLGWIAGNLVLDNDHNPIGPEHIGVAIHEAFATCELSLEVRLVVIKLCERDLVPGIGRIYEALDQRLVQSGVMPEMPAARSPARPPSRATESEQEAADRQAMAEDDEASAPAWAARFTHRMAGMKGGMQASMGQGHYSDGPPGYAGGAQGVLLEALHPLLQESRGNRETPEPSRASSGGGDNRPLSQREMLSVLSLLQSTPSATLRAAIGDTGESLAQRLKSEVLSGATQLGV